MSAAAAASAAVGTDAKPAILAALETMRMGQLATGGPAAKFKAIAYAKAIAAIKRYDGPVTSVADVEGLDGVGKKISEKVAEILATGKLAAAERVRESTDVGAYETLLGIHGIGPVKARELVAAGYKSVGSLRAAVARNPGLLTDAAKLGLQYYEAGIMRIPRAEMEMHEATLLAALPSELRGVIVGSYRRGAADSGDVDMLVSYPAAMSDAAAQGLFSDFVRVLGASGYIIDKLVSGPKKWMGYVRLAAGGTPRRLDLLLTPPAEYPYAIVYFTGSDKFNIGMRRWALERGYTMNEHTLTPVRAGVPAVPPMKTERDVFRFLEIKFIKPWERVDARQIIPLAAAAGAGKN